MTYMICYDNDSIYWSGSYNDTIALNSSLMGIEVETFESEEEMQKRYEILEKGIDKE